MSVIMKRLSRAKKRGELALDDDRTVLISICTQDQPATPPRRKLKSVNLLGLRGTAPAHPVNNHVYEKATALMTFAIPLLPVAI